METAGDCANLLAATQRFLVGQQPLANLTGRGGYRGSPGGHSMPEGLGPNQVC